MEALNALGINLGLLIANTLNLILMIVVIRVIAYKPITNMLQQRRTRIAEGMNNARKAEEALASAETDKQALLDEARAEAQRLTTEARSRAEEAAKQIEAEARAEATRILDQASVDAAAEKEMQLADARDQIISLSIAAANHLVATGLNEKKQKELVTEFFTAVPAEAKGMSGSVEVVTAVPLSAAEQKKFTKELGTEEITFMTNPSILGGVVVRSEGQQIDASFANQLVELRGSLN